MIRPGFLDAAARRALIAVMKNSKAESRVTRRANAIFLLDDGLSCEKVAEVLYLDDDTVRDWHRVWEAEGIKGLGALRTLSRVPYNVFAQRLIDDGLIAAILCPALEPRHHV